jgi:CubicO group peptidase (beta-lactamase class C family)
LTDGQKGGDSERLLPGFLNSEAAVLLIPALFLLLAGSDTTKADPIPTTLGEFRARVDSILRQTKTPGAGIALIQGDTVVWAGGIGLADVASNRPADSLTLWRIGSTSKAFAAMVILRLVTEGKLSLDTPVHDLVPEIKFENRWEKTDPVRVVHLLEHTTGWDDLALRDYGNSDSTPLTLRQGLDFDPAPRVCRWRPGTRFAYNNAGPAVAAYIAEKLEGHPFEELAWDWFFEPIGMHTATYLRTTRVVEHGATLYFPDGKTPYPYWHIIMRPAGAINASVLDMAAYLRFLLGRGTVDGREVLPRVDLERMEHPASSLAARAGLRYGYGLHLYASVDSGFVWYGHDGGVNGGLTNMQYMPGTGLGYVVMINSGSGDALRRIGRVVRRFLTRGMAPPALPPAARLDPATRSGWAGWFRPDNPRRQDTYFIERVAGLTRVRTTDTSLVMRPLFGGGETYPAVTPTLLRPTHTGEPVLALDRDPEDGRAVAIESGIGTTFHRIAAPVAWLELGGSILWLLGLVATLLFGLIWVPRWLFGRLRGVGHLRVRAWPLVAALIILGAIGITIATGDDPFGTLAKPTPWSVGFFLLTLAYPLVAVAGLASAWRVPSDEIRPALRRFVLATSMLNVVAALYLTLNGVVGWRSWA